MATRYTFSPVKATFPSANSPALTAINLRPVLAFDASTDETAYFDNNVAPEGLTGTITVTIHYVMASATSGSVRWQAALEAVTPGDATDLDATTSFDTSNSNGATVPGTAGYLGTVAITMTNTDSIAAGDYFRLSINRDADGTSGTDDATGDAYLLVVELKDEGDL